MAGAPDYVTVYSLNQLAAALFSADAQGRGKFANGFVNFALLDAALQALLVEPYEARYPALGSALGQVLSSGTTQYIPVRGAGAANAAENTVEVTVSEAGSIETLLLDMSVNGITAGNHVFTLRKNGADTGLTLTLNAASGTGVFAFTGGPISVVAGDRLALKSVGAAAGNITVRSCKGKFRKA